MSFITTRLSGRLGNQLYQISAALAIAYKNGADFFLYPKPDSADEPNYFKGIFPELPGDRRIEFEHVEKSHAYEPIEYKPNMCLTGYYQSHKYWMDVTEAVLPKFEIKPLARPDTIAIHRRMGDFLTLTGKHNVITDDYIMRAMRHFTDRGFERFKVFSDQPELCKQMFQYDEFKNLHIEFSEGKTAIEDMTEFAACHSQIMSASTFSYWGYFLNPNQFKSCIIPDNLWGDTHQSTFQNDTFPPDCIKIKN